MKRIIRFFAENVNKGHTSAGLRIKNIYTVEIPAMKAAFEADGKKVGNIKQLWHGTRTFNVLSILKSGLVVPKSAPGSTFAITGRMFGDGLYFSDQSTKSLNYSQGFWDRTSPRDNKCFMFLADVAMGKEYTPSRPEQHIPRGYDSMLAKAGKSGVLNNEMVVYRLGQANLRYLIEFEG